MFDLPENRLRFGKQCLARLGQLDAARLAPEQLDLELGFERPDLLTQRRLLDAEAPRSAGDMALLGDRNEVAKMAQIHMPGISIVPYQYIGQAVSTRLNSS